MNTTEDRDYILPTSTGIRHAADLIAGKEIDLTGSVKVPPLTTVVVDLERSDPSGR